MMWNLNTGLYNMCLAIEDIERQLADLDQKIVHVSQQVRQKL